MAQEASSAHAVTFKEFAVLEGHTGTTWDVAWYRDESGKFPVKLATCSADKTVRIYTQREARWVSSKEAFLEPQVLEHVHDRSIRAVAWHPNGQELTAVGFDKKISSWDIDRLGAKEPEIKLEVEGHRNEIKSAQWTNDGALLATTGRDKQVWVWESTDEGTDCDVVAVLSGSSGHTQDVKMARWQNGERDTLISCSYDNTIKVWMIDGDDYYCRETLEAHSATVWAISFCPSATERLASCSADSSIIIWENRPVDEGNAWQKVGSVENAHRGDVYSVEWLDESTLMSAGADGFIRLWRLTEASVIAPVAAHRVCPSEVNDAQPLRVDGHTIVAVCSDDGNVYLLELTGV